MKSSLRRLLRSAARRRLAWLVLAATTRTRSRSIRAASRASAFSSSRRRPGRTRRSLAALGERFGDLPDREFVDELALATQVVPKDEQLDWSHGYLLYAALGSYLRRTPSDRPVTIFETGTARGFSAICMAQALRDAGRAGTILTVDILHAERPIYWNSIADVEGPRTRLELLEPWAGLVEDHVVFLRGDVSIALEQLGLPRIHFAFLDAEHTYDAVRSELAFVARHQRAGDVIVCDDYTPKEFPGDRSGRRRARRQRSRTSSRPTPARPIAGYALPAEVL